MNNKLIIGVVIIILIAGGFFLFKSKGVAPVVPAENESVGEEASNVEDGVLNVGVTVTTGLKEFTVNSAPYSFSTKTITVNKGDTVKITLKNTQGTHDLKIDAYGVATRVLNPGEEQTLTFLADKAGSFEYYCSVGNHRAMGMVGTLTVR